MQAYAEFGFYDYYSGMIEDELESYLLKASRKVDTLTFNRIRAIGFENLSEFQKELVQEVVCELADFIYENQDALTSPIASYSLNGASVTFGSGVNMLRVQNVLLPSDVYEKLKQTGLCDRRC